MNVRHNLRRFCLGACGLALFASIACASDLIFLTDAVNTFSGEKYKAYIDKETIHVEGSYKTVKLISVYEKPISIAGYEGVKSMANTFQIDCARNVKRVTYIAFLDSQDRVIIDKKYPNAADETIGNDTVDRKVLPYLCTNR